MARYTKALDNIKQLKKQGVQDLKVENERLTHLKKDKDRAESVSKLRYAGRGHT